MRFWLCQVLWLKKQRCYTCALIVIVAFFVCYGGGGGRRGRIFFPMLWLTWFLFVCITDKPKCQRSEPCARVVGRTTYTRVRHLLF